jgi:hypothetical protein
MREGALRSTTGEANLECVSNMLRRAEESARERLRLDSAVLDEARGVDWG